MDRNFDMDINDTSSFKDEDVTNDIIKVIGVGGGGGNAVNYMYKQQIPHIQFVVCNTDKQALDRSEVPKHVLLGYNITKGLGAGNVPEVGRQCAEASEEEIRAQIQASLAALGIEQPTIRDKGRLMTELMPRVKGKADGALVNRLVTELLA